MLDQIQKKLGFQNHFYSGFEIEDNFSRTAIVNGIGALILTPIFALFLYTSGAPINYIYLAFSYSLGYLIYVSICWLIKELNRQLIYFLFIHLSVISFFVIRELAFNGFKYNEVVYALAFYILSTIIIQRLYPAVLYHIFIIALLSYKYKTVESSEIPLEFIIPFFGLFGVASSLMIYARGILIQNNQEYSKYLKRLISKPGNGFILFTINNEIKIIDQSNDLETYFDLNDESKLELVFNNQFDKGELKNIESLKIGNRIKKKIILEVAGRRKEIDLNIQIILIRKNKFWLANINDVTKQNKKRRDLELNERKYRNLYYKNKAGVFTITNRSEIIDGNESFFKMFENTIQIGEKLFGTDKKEDWKYILDSIDESGSVQNYQTKFKLSNGVNKTFIFSWYIDDQTSFIEGSVIDLTNIQKASQALKQSEQKYRLIFEESNDAILLLIGDKIVDANRTTALLFGKELNEIKKLKLFDLSWKKTPGEEKKFQQFKYDLSYKRSTKFNWLFKGKEGNVIEAEVSLIEIILENKLYYQCVIHDQTKQNKLAKEKLRAEFAEETNIKLEEEIKERIKAEKKVQDEFLRTKAILDSSSNTFLLTLSLKKKITSFNYHFEYYFDKVFNRKVKVGLAFSDYFRGVISEKELRLFSFYLYQVGKGESHQIEVELTGINGNEYWMDIFMNPIFNAKGEVAEISLVAHDISEKKKTSIEVRESLKEKEVLLKEIHHRVKNNLQVISSILNLQSSFVDDEKTLSILQESRNRIRSMAIIHENLYKTEDFSNIKFGEYLNNLTANLLASYTISEEIFLNSEIDSVDLVLDQAIPCGLVVNEIITNSLKYAWDKGEQGTFSIKLTQKGQKVYLTLSDDGKGLPDDFDKIQEETLGLQLVVTLVDQLDGELIVDSKNGTKYLIKFNNIKTLSDVKN